MNLDRREFIKLGTPCLIDKEKDPDELINFSSNPKCREIVRQMAKQLAA